MYLFLIIDFNRKESLIKMHLGVNLSNALQQLESVKAAVDQSDDPKLKASTSDDLNMLINLLDSPILRSIATLHDSVGMLATQVAHHPSILPGDFDITPAGKCLYIIPIAKIFNWFLIVL